jgi:hypothetical protein
MSGNSGFSLLEARIVYRIYECEVTLDVGSVSMERANVNWVSTFMTVCCLGLSGQSLAVVPVAVNVDAGSIANLTVAVTIGTPPDTETSVDSSMLPVSGGGNIQLSPDIEPFTSVGLNQLQFFFGSTNLNYQFFCGTWL